MGLDHRGLGRIASRFGAQLFRWIHQGFHLGWNLKVLWQPACTPRTYDGDRDGIGRCKFVGKG